MISVVIQPICRLHYLKNYEQAGIYGSHKFSGSNNQHHGPSNIRGRMTLKSFLSVNLVFYRVIIISIFSASFLVSLKSVDIIKVTGFYVMSASKRNFDYIFIYPSSIIFEFSFTKTTIQPHSKLSYGEETEKILEWQLANLLKY